MSKYPSAFILSSFPLTTFPICQLKNNQKRQIKKGASNRTLFSGPNTLYHHHTYNPNYAILRFFHIRQLHYSLKQLFVNTFLSKNGGILVPINSKLVEIS
jgi:hypothetical protein